jgi:hypothetical protein
VGAYKKHFHTASACAIVELAALGIALPEGQVAEAAAGQIGAAQALRARKLKKKQQKAKGQVPRRFAADFDDRYAVFAGFTSGGAPYGTTWEELKGIEMRERVGSQASRPYREDWEEGPFLFISECRSWGAARVCTGEKRAEWRVNTAWEDVYDPFAE